MGVERLHYYRVTCDSEGCRGYINLAAKNEVHLREVLAEPNKWAVTVIGQGGNPFVMAWCPSHKEQA